MSFVVGFFFRADVLFNHIQNLKLHLTLVSSLLGQTMKTMKTYNEQNGRNNQYKAGFRFCCYEFGIYL